MFICLFFFFTDTATTEIYTLSLHDALPISRPGHDRRSHVAHGEHPVGDDPWEPGRAGERVVLVERVLVATDVGVRLDVFARDDAGELGKLLPDRDRRSAPHTPAARSIICERAVQTTTPSASSRSMAIVTNPFPPLIRIDSMRARTASSSPSWSARRNP